MSQEFLSGGRLRVGRFREGRPGEETEAEFLAFRQTVEELRNPLATDGVWFNKDLMVR